MLRYSRPLVMIALVLLLAACGGEATLSTGQSLGGATATTAPASAATSAAPSAAASVAASAAPSAAPSAPAATATVAATATTAATATAAASPTTAATATAPAATRAPATPTTATAQRTPTEPAGSGSTMVVTDSDKRCQMMLPPGMTEDSPGSGEFTIANDGGLALLQSIEGAEMGTTVSLFVQSFSPVFANYQETDRKTTADSEQIDFTGELIRPIKGTMYFKQIDNVICNIILVVYQDANYPYEQTLAGMIGSVQLVKP